MEGQEFDIFLCVSITLYFLKITGTGKDYQRETTVVSKESGIMKSSLLNGFVSEVSISS